MTNGENVNAQKPTSMYAYCFKFPIKGENQMRINGNYHMGCKRHHVCINSTFNTRLHKYLHKPVELFQCQYLSFNTIVVHLIWCFPTQGTLGVYRYLCCYVVKNWNILMEIDTSLHIANCFILTTMSAVEKFLKAISINCIIDILHLYM